MYAVTLYIYLIVLAVIFDERCPGTVCILCCMQTAGVVKMCKNCNYNKSWLDAL